MKLKKLIKYIVFILTGLVALVVLFLNLSDINQAKVLLNTLGVHENNQLKFSKVVEIIKKKGAEYNYEVKEISENHRILIEADINRWKHESDSSRWLTLSDVYAKEGEDWNSTCMIKYGLPNRKFEYLVYTEDSIIICYTVGGLSSSRFFDFYEIKSEELELVGTVNSRETSLFMLASELKFDDSLILWNSKKGNDEVELNKKKLSTITKAKTVRQEVAINTVKLQNINPLT